MEPKAKFIISLDRAYEYPVRLIGGKSRNASICKREGFLVPDGFCISTDSYRAFVKENKLSANINFEVMRKPYEEMRWEEIWDVALRIRSSFIKARMPDFLERKILKALSKWPEGTLLAIRSSSPDEDSKDYSFAGVHESFINVSGETEVLEKIKLVWASLWSDRSLLYKKEKSLDSIKSLMAVLVQKMETKDVSGLAFSADPSDKDKNYIIIEAIRGSLDLLVDNVKSPERFKINKKTGEVHSSKLLADDKLLDAESIQMLRTRVLEIENLFGEPVDIEWTGLKEDFTVLQVRPITIFKNDSNMERKWYLTLTPKGKKLINLAEKVENVLIPELMKTCEKYAELLPEALDKETFLAGLKDRGDSYERWTKIYLDEFIPFAQGIRNFGTFYNDLLKPQNAYQFVELLKTEGHIARRRNTEMSILAENLNQYPEFKRELRILIKQNIRGGELLKALTERKQAKGPESEFLLRFFEFLNKEMDFTYENVSLNLAPEVSLHVILALSTNHEESSIKDDLNEGYQKEYLETADKFRKKDEAVQWLRVGRVSWRLRDDDNILMGRLENQLLLFMREGAKILAIGGQIKELPELMDLSDWRKIYQGLTSSTLIKVELVPVLKGSTLTNPSDGKPRQLVGQPSSPGLITGKARVILSLEDFKSIDNGEILVFDAVQPQMTFIIPLAGAIVERRGGMLVHSSIIAREMNIPAVNGVSKATELIHTGDIVTVNGDLGIVVIGRPEFDIELNKSAGGSEIGIQNL